MSGEEISLWMISMKLIISEETGMNGYLIH